MSIYIHKYLCMGIYEYTGIYVDTCVIYTIPHINSQTSKTLKLHEILISYTETPK